MMGNKSFLCLLGVLVTARITLQASSPSSTYYVGATVEYHPVMNGENATAIADENVKNYLKILKKASEHEVDIIVFPESSLTVGKMVSVDERSRFLPHSAYLPNPKDNVTPCKNDSFKTMQAVKAISCAAQQYAMYVVINIREKANCTVEKIMKGCNPDGHEFYNTNVVFDRHGTVIARYRKYNLFGEIGFNKTEMAEMSTFKTDFDVTFGQIICFDLLFESPGLKLARDNKITNIVFSSNWFSELPFLTSLASQSAWAYSTNANFLASGFNNPPKGSTGSGIYAGKEGALVTVWSEKRANALLVAKIPKLVGERRDYRPNPTESITYFFPKNEIATIDGNEPVPQQVLQTDDLSSYTTVLFPPTNGSYSLTLCDRQLCCKFTTDTTHHNIVAQNNLKYFRYRFAVFNGVRSFTGQGTGGVEICGIISCTDDTVKSCNRRFDTNEIIAHPVTFNSIVVTGNFTVGLKVHRMPIAINTDLQPLNVSDFMYVESILNQTHASAQLSLMKNKSRNNKGLMSFAIYGRNFTRDGMPATGGQSLTSKPSILVFVLGTLLSLGIGSTFGTPANAA